jgi:hypothetical protein
MIDEEKLASTLQLFARLGDAAAKDALLEDAEEAVRGGRRDLATCLLDLSAEFHRLWREFKSEAGREADGLRVIGVSLRIVAHRLHKACGDEADDHRLLRLVHSAEELS